MARPAPVSELRGSATFRVIPILALLTALAVAGYLILAGASKASIPPASSITVPSGVATVTDTWTGTIPAGTNASSNCGPFADTATADTHTETINVPAGAYDSVQANFTQLVERMRQAFPGVRYSERLLSTQSRSRILGPGLNDNHLDIAISLLARQLRS